MIDVQYALLFLFAVYFSHRLLFRWWLNLKPTAVISLAAWTALIPASGNVVQYTDAGSAIASGDLFVQAIAIFMALVSGLALVGAHFEYYPTEEMIQNARTQKP